LVLVGCGCLTASLINIEKPRFTAVFLCLVELVRSGRSAILEPVIRHGLAAALLFIEKYPPDIPLTNFESQLTGRLLSRPLYPATEVPEDQPERANPERDVAPQ
jgi:hypothetical protein